MGGGQPARAAYDHNPLPLAALAAAGLRSFVQIEVDVVRDENIEVAVAVVIDKRAAGPPARAGDGKARGLGDIRESSSAQIPVETIVAVVSDQKVRMPVVVEIAYTGGLRPAGPRQPGLLTHFGKRPLPSLW